MIELLKYLKMYGLVVLDVLIVAFIIYNVYKMLVGTRAMPVVKGLVILGLAYFVGRMLKLNTFLWLFENGLEVAAIGLVVIFQDELRRIVMKLGENISLYSTAQKPDWSDTFTSLTQAVYHLANKSIGALVVLVRNTGLRGGIIEQGVRLDALLSQELLESIFMQSGPIHDGAVIIDDDRIISAGCLLPLTERTDLNMLFGTRHRAALGLTEVTDAVVIIVSEENKNVSVAHESKLYYDIRQEHFEETLKTMMKAKNRLQEENLSMKTKMKQKWLEFTRWFT